MIADFYDIESLTNAFTVANFQPYRNHIDVYVLADDPALYRIPDFERLVGEKIREANLNFDGTASVFDLHESANIIRMAETFGVSTAQSVNNPNDTTDMYGNRFRIVCDTDPGFDDDKYPYYMGYNSANYDTTMLTAFFMKSLFMTDRQDVPGGPVIKDLNVEPPTAKEMRDVNNTLFLPVFKNNMPDYLSKQISWNAAAGSYTASRPDFQSPGWKIRKNMLMTGRHVDVARLNDKASKVALKRLLGMLGGQILESRKLAQGQDTLYTPDELLDLIAYNASDVINLKYVLFDHPVYQGQFNLKKKLLSDYPELVYQKKLDAYAPDVNPARVRRDRLFIDSSSAQLATKALCPYEHLTDIPVVSYMYPSARKAKELGVPQVNVLEECRKFFYSKFPQPEIRAEFDKIYAFYKSIEGKNFNKSANYRMDYGYEDGSLPGKGQDPAYPEALYPFGLNPFDTKDIMKCDTCMCYYNADGTPSRGFVTFSIGGIHGAEYNRDKYLYDTYKYQVEQYLMRQAQAQYPDPVDLKIAKRVTVQVPNEEGNIKDVEFPAGKFLKSGSTRKKAEYKSLDKVPALFNRADDGTTSLNPAYVYTSADPTNHEDFKSYYPNLLRMLSAFYNQGLGYDRYAEIFYQKEDLGVLMEDKNADYAKLRSKTDPAVLARYDKLRASSGCTLDPDGISDEERAVYAVQREGTKLILNSASGAADASFESNIRMNNVIISMRVIGQLFSWRIGQAQTYEGAKVTSTNTDGLFTVMEAGLNEKILARESADIGVEIEPEPTYLISKDTNNRIEMDPDTGVVQAASGGTLGCRSWAGKKGPSPNKNLSHPAIIDWALCEYLVYAATNQTGRASLDAAFNPEVGLNILKSAKAKMDKVRLLNMFQNVVASSTGSIRYNFGVRPDRPDDPPIILQHYNRVFILKDNTPGTIHLAAAVARKLTPVQIANRKKNNERMYQHDPLASDILRANGVGIETLPEKYEAVISKLTNIEDDWFMFVENRALKYIPDDEVDFILDNLDYGKYLFLLAKGFEKSWRNDLPHGAPPTDMLPFTKDLDAAMAAYKSGKSADAPEDDAPAAPEKHVITPAPEPPDPEPENENPSGQADGAAPVTEPAGGPEAVGPGTGPVPDDLPWPEDPPGIPPTERPEEPSAASPEKSRTADTPDRDAHAVPADSTGQLALPGWDGPSETMSVHMAVLGALLENMLGNCDTVADYASQVCGLDGVGPGMDAVKFHISAALEILRKSADD